MTKEKPSGLQRQPKAGDGKQPERDEQLGKSILEMKRLETRGCEGYGNAARGCGKSLVRKAGARWCPSAGISRPRWQLLPVFGLPGWQRWLSTAGTQPVLLNNSHRKASSGDGRSIPAVPGSQSIARCAGDPLLPPGAAWEFWSPIRNGSRPHWGL